MSERIKQLWREPMLHFLLVGFALFVYFDLANEGAETAPKRIHVGQGQVQQLAANFQRIRLRPPTPEELDAMVESYVREEVLYREALAMGLDRDDPMVRRRLRMKLEFMLEDLSAQDFDDQVLDTYLQRNADRFRSEAQVSFRHIYLDPDRHADVAAAARTLLAGLNAGAVPDSLGDPTLLRRSYRLARQSEIARDLGGTFARGVAVMPTGEWRGPVESPFGAHLVRVDARIDARVPALDEVRDRVLAEYQAEQRRQLKDAAYRRLRQSYDVTVEPLPTRAATGGGVVREANAAQAQ